MDGAQQRNAIGCLAHQAVTPGWFQAGMRCRGGSGFRFARDFRVESIAGRAEVNDFAHAQGGPFGDHLTAHGSTVGGAEIFDPDTVSAVNDLRVVTANGSVFDEYLAVVFTTDNQFSRRERYGLMGLDVAKFVDHATNNTGL